MRCACYGPFDLVVFAVNCTVTSSVAFAMNCTVTSSVAFAVNCTVTNSIIQLFSWDCAIS